MSRLAYVSKGTILSSKLPKVFFCSHPADHAKMFPTISGDIFDVQNCVFCYDEDPLSATDDPRLYSDLQEVRLFVFAVTKRFLSEPNKARDLFLPLAFKNSTAVLPIIMEPNLDALFTKSFHALQYLSRIETDESVLPYEHKLKRFLSLIFSSDETVRRIQEAFDAYIFLSYRKIDRPLAQKLMRIIHEKEFCRDIAIWYDEFLTVGEDFNETISTAIERCDAFVMAITPNILQQNNYIIRREYPFALENQKDIVPIELEETERGLLHQRFKALPPCVAADDDDILSQALLSTFRRFALRGNDEDPTHNFLIGLAYLNGIDVEVNKERAFALIQSAAIKDLPEAIEKLVDMFWMGDSVARDCRKAIEWQTRLVAARKKTYNANDSEENALAYVHALCRLGEMQKDQGFFKEAVAPYTTARKIASGLTLKNKKHELLLSDCALTLGEVHGSLGNSGRQMLYLLESVLYATGTDPDVGEENTLYFERRLLQTVLSLSSGQKITDQQLESIVAKAEKLYNATGSSVDRILLMRVLFKMGEEKQKKDDPAAAEFYYRSKALLDSDSKNQSEDHLMRGISLHLAIADLPNENKLEHVCAALKIANSLSDSAKTRTCLAMVHGKCFMVYREMEIPSKAQDHAEKALSYLYAVAEETKNAEAYETIITMETILNAPDCDAITFFREVAARWKKVQKENPNDKYIAKKAKTAKRMHFLLRLLKPIMK